MLEIIQETYMNEQRFRWWTMKIRRLIWGYIGREHIYTILPFYHVCINGLNNYVVS